MVVFFFFQRLGAFSFANLFACAAGT